jgi:hypothetical protein
MIKGHDNPVGFIGITLKVKSEKVEVKSEGYRV